jgi:ribose transport system ATP-binding protein
MNSGRIRDGGNAVRTKGAGGAGGMHGRMAEPALRASGIIKTFPGVRALKGVSVEVYRGEVHALIGENGAGKSTLVRILSGLDSPDGGEIWLRGRRLAIAHPHAAQLAGISTVHQELSLVPTLTVEENLLLGREPHGRLGIIRRDEVLRRTREVLNTLEADLDLGALAGELSPAQQQLAEIAKALTFSPAVLILDEPTSVLAPREVAHLAGVLRRLRAQGVAIVFISHRLEEVFALADRITVLKDGSVVGTVAAAGITRGESIKMMVGRDLGDAFSGTREPHSGGVSLLELRGLRHPPSLRGMTFTVHAGEILGLGGLEGQGQRALVRGLAGIDPVAEGSIRLMGQPLALRAPSDAVAAGIAFVPDDRKTEGVLPPLSVLENMSAATLRRWQRYGIIRHDEERRAVRTQIEALQIRTPSEDQEIATLSGGSQQKVILGRWLLAQPRLLILDEPTRGIDVATKFEIYALVRRLAESGLAILLHTSDMLELLGLSDRIAVVYEGRIMGVLARGEATEERVMALASGGSA